MAINENFICVLDTETTHLSSKQGEIVQLAAVMIEPRSLSIHPGSEFNMLIKPDRLKTDAEWLAHAGAFSVNKIKREDLEVAPSQKAVWEEFVKYVKKYNCGKDSKWNRPILAGQNIIGFDLKFLQAMADRFGPVDGDGYISLFSPRVILDTLAISWLWYENQMEPASYSVDTMVDWTGYQVDKANLHDAKQDTLFTAELLISYLKRNRHWVKKSRFKGCLSKERKEELARSGKV